tara:strand:+ start:99 stop:392 length:294 start_codon:yes stop_codon:yes gene_type:complete
MIFKYTIHNKYLFLITAYFVFSSILYAISGFNITIPCIWNLMFDIHCPGCGLTTAFIDLLNIDPVSAWKSNPLIFLMVPMVLIYFFLDFRRFKNKII